jgi:catechol 2,3-dioxygenase-like lactoylglutathione lyase family enzyme
MLYERQFFHFLDWVISHCQGKDRGHELKPVEYGRHTLERVQFISHQSFGRWSVLLLIALARSCWSSQSPSPVLGSGRGIDHVEVVVRDLTATAKIYHDHLGFTVGGQGKHPGGTANAVIGFKNKTYFELISIYDRDRAAKNEADMIAFLDKHEGALQAGLEIASADETAAYLRTRGFDIVGPVGGTFKPDGVKETPPELYKDVLFKKPAVPGDTIFFAEYHHDAWRKLQKEYPQLLDDPAKSTHANGSLDIQAVWMSVKNLDMATKAYESVGFSRGARIELPAIGATAQEFHAGDGTILLVSPAASRSGGAVRKFLSDRGESVMGVSIEVQRLAETQSVLKEGLHKSLKTYPGLYGESVVVPGGFAAGVWIEFFEKAK